jgi:hypothetical protein
MNFMGEAKVTRQISTDVKPTMSGTLRIERNRLAIVLGQLGKIVTSPTSEFHVSDQCVSFRERVQGDFSHCGGTRSVKAKDHEAVCWGQAERVLQAQPSWLAK